MSNIAEGFESHTNGQFIRYLGFAKASAGEVRSQLYLALDLQYIDQQQFEGLCDLANKASRQIYNLISYLEKTPNRRRVRETGSVYEIALNVKCLTLNV